MKTPSIYQSVQSCYVSLLSILVMPISLCFVNYSTPISIQYPVQSPNTFTQHSQPWVQNCSKICIYLHPVNSMSYSKLYFGPFTTQLTPSHYTAPKKNTHTLYLKVNYMQCFCFFLHERPCSQKQNTCIMS